MSDMLQLDMLQLVGVPSTPPSRFYPKPGNPNRDKTQAYRTYREVNLRMKVLPFRLTPNYAGTI